MYNTDEITEKIILLSVDPDDGQDIDANLDELEELIKTAGGVVVGRMIQKKESIDKATYIGSGKTLELKALVEELGATGVCSDDELSPMQIKNLEELIDTKIIDRTTVILDIFASRASTKEGKIQIELAQLKYRSSRLVGMRSSLSRLGGGIGTRGPGEKKLEIDRRVIKERIAQLGRELEDVKQHREVMRKQRINGSLPVVAIVGYTNAGKSTLLNHLTLAGVLEEDKLFATLDPTSRSYTLGNGQEIIITDTVGFIKKLPHHLINAFRSTLEEAKYADIILHVVDISNPNADEQIATVYDTLGRLGIQDKPIITAFNKIDKVEQMPVIKDCKADETVYIAAKQEKGFDKLSAVIEAEVLKSRNYIERLISYNDAGMINRIRKSGTILEEDYREDGIYIRAYADKTIDI
ncbi:MAG: GTPase HflX [Clostridium sp.]|nr:GTPase HflX [Clostridium sp.]